MVEGNGLWCPRCGEVVHYQDVNDQPEAYWTCPLCGTIEHKACHGPLDDDNEIAELLDELESLKLQLTRTIRQRNRARAASRDKDGELSYLRPALNDCQTELEQARQNLADLKRLEALHRSVEQGWLDEVKVENERLKKKLVAQQAAFQKAVDWLWGFWDGNTTLIAAPSADKEALYKAWDDLLAVSTYPWKEAAALLERLEKAEAEVKRLRGVVAKLIKQRQVEVTKTLAARSDTEDALLKVYNECQNEVKRLQGCAGGG